jgi:hypothetical protein
VAKPSNEQLLTIADFEDFEGVALILDTDLRQREQPSVVGEALIL